MSEQAENFVFIIVIIAIIIIVLFFFQMLLGMLAINPLMGLAVIAFIVVIAGCAFLGAN